ncbi:baseplate J family protein [Candidatus Hepatincola sp. Av]
MIKPKAVKEVDFQSLLERNQKLLESVAPDTYKNLSAVDPANKLMGISAYIEGLVRNKVNNALLAVMVDFAEDEDLDNLGNFYGLTRKVLEDGDSKATPPLPAIYETDEEFRARIKQAPFGFSVAGPTASYEFYGKEADIAVKDISAVSHSPCVVDITVLSYSGNGVADSNLLNTVTLALNDELVRPVGDLVNVKSAEIIEYEIAVTIRPQDNTPESAIDLNQIIANLQSYADSEHRCGGMVVASGIYANSHIAGVEQVTITSPTEDIICTPAQAPYCLKITAEFIAITDSAIQKVSKGKLYARKAK